MFFEPAPTNFDLNFSIARIPVRVHPMFWLVACLIGFNPGQPASMVAWVLALFVSILIHELGHAFTIRAYGWRTNVVLYGFGGFATYAPPYWRPLEQVIVALAGPFAGFALALLVFVAAFVAQVPLWVNLGLVAFRVVDAPVHNVFVAEFMNDMMFICVFWGLVNLLPIYPLDGGRVSMAVLLVRDAYDGARKAYLISGVTAALVAIVFLTQFESIFGAFFFGFMAMGSFQMAYGGPTWRY